MSASRSPSGRSSSAPPPGDNLDKHCACKSVDANIRFLALVTRRRFRVGENPTRPTEGGVSGSVPVEERPVGAALFAKLQRGDIVIAAAVTRDKGTAELTYDPDTRIVTWTINFSDLSGPATMAHFHGPAMAGRNGPVILWLTNKGSPAESPIQGSATLTPDQAKEFSAGQWYINVHTNKNPAGEIRGQVNPPKG
jgi:hypothetical protein